MMLGQCMLPVIDFDLNLQQQCVEIVSARMFRHSQLFMQLSSAIINPTSYKEPTKCYFCLLSAISAACTCVYTYVQYVCMYVCVLACI